jgi:hypothetical protein
VAFQLATTPLSTLGAVTTERIRAIERDVRDTLQGYLSEGGLSVPMMPHLVGALAKPWSDRSCSSLIGPLTGVGRQAGRRASVELHRPGPFPFPAFPVRRGKESDRGGRASAPLATSQREKGPENGGFSGAANVNISPAPKIVPTPVSDRGREGRVCFPPGVLCVDRSDRNRGQHRIHRRGSARRPRASS